MKAEEKTVKRWRNTETYFTNEVKDVTDTDKGEERKIGGSRRERWW